MRDLSEIRVDIDAVDQQLAVLFEKRMDLAVQVAEYKQANHLPIFIPEREKVVLEKKMALFAHKDETYREYVRVFYQTLMDLSKEEQMRVIENRQPE